jgi:hypothetical protein
LDARENTGVNACAALLAVHSENKCAPMMNSTIFAFCAVFICALGIIAISTIPSLTPEPTADTDLDKSMDTMHAEMQKVRSSGNADADFASLMIPHHQGAIEMSKVELQFGTDPRLRRLAQEIIVTQQSEIEVMKGAIRDLPPPLLSLKQKNWCTR